MSDHSSISEERMRAALRSSGPSSAPSAAAPRGRHRFVQDGEVPVVVVNQRPRHGEDRGGATAELERALRTEREARLAAEKALQHAEDTVRQLQTRLAHAEMAQAEAVRVARAEMAEAQEEAARLAALVPSPADAEPGTATPCARALQPGPAIDEEQPVEWWLPGWKDRLRSPG